MNTYYEQNKQRLKLKQRFLDKIRKLKQSGGSAEEINQLELQANQYRKPKQMRKKRSISERHCFDPSSWSISSRSVNTCVMKHLLNDYEAIRLNRIDIARATGDYYRDLSIPYADLRVGDGYRPSIKEIKIAQTPGYAY